MSASSSPKALWLGIAAASLIFLASYAEGMVSLGQVGLYAIAGMMFANLVAADGGLDAAWNPWVAVIAALLIATLAGLLFGAVAARSEGIYFLMITLALGVLVYYFSPRRPSCRALAASTTRSCLRSSGTRAPIPSRSST